MGKKFEKEKIVQILLVVVVVLLGLFGYGFYRYYNLSNGLSDIPKEYLLQKERTLKIHSKVLPYLEEMIKAMRENQTPIEIVSAYRSFGEQSSLKNNYNVVYGAGANTFSADQGYSEHQLGTALDSTTENLGANFTDFGDTKAYQWLLENAYKYG